MGALSKLSFAHTLRLSPRPMSSLFGRFDSPPSQPASMLLQVEPRLARRESALVRGLESVRFTSMLLNSNGPDRLGRNVAAVAEGSSPPAPGSRESRPPRKMRFLPLIAATFFMVSGGPYAIEDILGGAGYERAIVILLLLPVFWSLPTALMIGELASAIPSDGGFYVWVRRAMGPFWGFQEGWLSLAASVLDMAIYPAFVVSYLGKFNPGLTANWRGYAWSLAVVALCCASGAGSRCIPQCSGAGRHRTRRSRPQSWWRCGITWGGTTPRLSPRRFTTRSEPILAP